MKTNLYALLRFSLPLVSELSCDSDLGEIISEHLQHGRIVERLKI
jgi:hypothetical protein